MSHTYSKIAYLMDVYAMQQVVSEHDVRQILTIAKFNNFKRKYKKLITFYPEEKNYYYFEDLQEFIDSL
jgi:hypothetical protein